jgi:hypothetical protein
VRIFAAHVVSWTVAILAGIFTAAGMVFLLLFVASREMLRRMVNS